MINLRYYLSKLMELINFPSVKLSSLDKSVWLGSGTQIVHTSISYGTYIGKNVQCLYAEIGKFCSIANNCIVSGAEHPLNFVSTSPVFYGGYKNPLSWNKIQIGALSWNPYKKHTIIGNDVWIGNNVIIKAGVKIGTGAVIGAGAVVVKDVPAYEIWGGNPAKCIRKRFEEDIIKRLLCSNWWNLDNETLSKYSMHMNKPDVFLQDIEKINKNLNG